MPYIITSRAEVKKQERELSVLEKKVADLMTAGHKAGALCPGTTIYRNLLPVCTVYWKVMCRIQRSGKYPLWLRVSPRGLREPLLVRMSSSHPETWFTDCVEVRASR